MPEVIFENGHLIYREDGREFPANGAMTNSGQNRYYRFVASPANMQTPVLTDATFIERDDGKLSLYGQQASEVPGSTRSTTSVAMATFTNGEACALDVLRMDPQKSGSLMMGSYGHVTKIHTDDGRVWPLEGQKQNGETPTLQPMGLTREQGRVMIDGLWGSPETGERRKGEIAAIETERGYTFYPAIRHGANGTSGSYVCYRPLTVDRRAGNFPAPRPS